MADTPHPDGGGEEDATGALARTVAVTRPSALAELLSVAAGSVAVLLAVLPEPSPGSLVAAACAAVASAIAWVVPRRRSEGARLTRDGDAIVLEDGARIPVASIRAVDVHAADEDAPSDVRMRWLDARDCVIADIELASDDDAERLLRELGIDGARPARELALLPQPFAFSAGAHRAVSLLGAVTLAVVARADLSWLSIFAFPFVFVLAGAALSGRVRIGDDGFELRPALGRARYVRFGDVASVERDRGTVEVRLHGGERIEIAVAGVRKGRWASARADAIANAILRGIARKRDTGERDAGERDAIAGLLARGEREDEPWRASLRELAREGGYRGAAISDDALAALVADGDADPSAREGAAIVLRERGFDRARLREMAERSAHPRVRVVVEELAEEESEGEERGRERRVR